jgi:hypothetical protein
MFYESFKKQKVIISLFNFNNNNNNISFKFDYNNLGHGSYLISSNAYSWSHSVKEDNIA